MCVNKICTSYSSPTSKFLLSMNWTECFDAFTHLHWTVSSLFSCLSEVNDAWTAGRSLTVNHMVLCKRSPVFLRVSTECPNIDKRDPCMLMTFSIPLCKEKTSRWEVIVFLRQQWLQYTDRKLRNEQIHYNPSYPPD